VYLFRGSTFPDNTVDVIINGSEDLGEFGTSVAGVFDVDLDGSDDLLAGAPSEDGDGNTATSAAPFLGRAYLFFGSSLAGVATTSSFAASRIFTGTEAGADFGAFVAGLGDVSGDGAADLFIGAPLDDGDGNATDEGEDRGRGFVHFGGPGVDTIADATLTGSEADGHFGAWAGAGGDVDGDDGRDFAVGAPLDDADGNATDEGLNRGRVLFFRGGGALDSSSDDSLEGSLEDGAEAGTSGA
jgi:hypothetical protein